MNDVGNGKKKSVENLPVAKDKCQVNVFFYVVISCPMSA